MKEQGTLSHLPVLIADDFHHSLLNKFDDFAIPYIYAPEASRAEILVSLAAGCSGLILRSKTAVDKELLSASPHLKFVGRGGAGMENVDIDTAKALNIACFHAAGANAQAVGEHTVGMLLSLLNNLAKADAEVRKRVWLREENRGVELKGKTVGIIGFGHTGSAVARCLSGFGVNLLTYDKYKPSGYAKGLANEVSLEEIQKNAEIITLHVPLTPETMFMINSDFVHNCVRNFWLLNLSRGEVVQTADIVTALSSGKIIGFAADVLECEKFSNFKPLDDVWFNYLAQSGRVVLSPHIGGWTVESYERISSVIATQVIEYLSNNR